MRTPLLLAAAAALVLAACGGDDDPAVGGTSPADGAIEATTAPGATGGDDQAAGETVAVSSSDLGDILVDADGRTLYAFLPDEGGTPSCTGDCLAAWPVLEGPVSAGDGVDAALLGTADHPEGPTMASYGGWPLYRFASDQGPGDTNGQGVGGNWFVMGADGEPVQDEAEAAAATSGGVVDYGY